MVSRVTHCETCGEEIDVGKHECALYKGCEIGCAEKLRAAGYTDCPLNPDDQKRCLGHWLEELRQGINPVNGSPHKAHHTDLFSFVPTYKKGSS